MVYSTDFINPYSLNNKLDDLCPYEYDIDDFTREYKEYREAMMISDTVSPLTRKARKQVSARTYEELIEQIKTKSNLAEEALPPPREPHPATHAIRGYLSSRPKDRITKTEKNSTPNGPTLLQISIDKISRFLKKVTLFNPRTMMRKVFDYMMDMPVFWPIWTILSLAITAAVSIATAMKASIEAGGLTFDNFIQVMPSLPAFVISTIIPAPVYILTFVFISIITMDIVVAIWQKIREEIRG